MKWKLIPRLFLTVVALAAFCCFAAAADSDFEIADGRLTAYHGPGGNVIIPEGVVEIVGSAFDQNNSITSVVIPKGVLSIGGFTSCENLTSVTLPDGLLEIQPYTFSNCKKLARIDIPDSVLFIDEAFRGCSNLTQVRLPENTAVVDGAFGKTPWGDANITGVQPPMPTVSITHVRTGTYTRVKSSGAVRQGDFAIRDGVVTGYYGAGGVVKLPDGVTAVGANAFQGNTNITSVTVPESLRMIGVRAFQDCTRLTSVSRFPNNLKRVGRYAFYGCTALSSVDIPAKAVVEPSAFAGTPYNDTEGAPCMTENAFSSVRKYAGTYRDVTAKSWFYPYFIKAYEAGVMNGKSESAFDPNGTLSIAEGIQTAAIIHAAATGQRAQLQPGTPWYQTYYDYWDRYSDHDIAEWKDYNRPIRRSEFAELLHCALPYGEWSSFHINTKMVPDMYEQRADGATYPLSYSDSVDTLYTAGVCVLYTDGKFHPERNITRAEAVVMAARTIDPSLRSQPS